MAAEGRSLTRRALIAISLSLLVFFGLTVAALDIAFHNSAERAIRDRLHVQAVGLMAAADFDDKGRLDVSKALIDARLANPASGEYAAIYDVSAGKFLWRSPSAVGVSLGSVDVGGVGDTLSGIRQTADGLLFESATTVAWDMADGHARELVFMSAEDGGGFLDQVGHFRANLLTWFGGMAVLMLGVQLFVLRRVLRPLKNVAREVEEIRAGERAQLADGFPRELEGLAQSLNALIDAERKRMHRYRDSLADLAHSLKTPLAVMQSLLGGVQGLDPEIRVRIGQELERMDDIVAHRLQRAAAGSATFAAPIPLLPAIERMRDSLEKVHAEKAPEIELDVAAALRVAMDEGDLLELLGNLMDNACKWCARRVTVSARAVPGAVRIDVEDDGPGISVADAEAVLERGVRADNRVPGQGIGLAVVADMVRGQGGSVEIGRSSLGGARISVTLPYGSAA